MWVCGGLDGEGEWVDLFVSWVEVVGCAGGFVVVRLLGNNGGFSTWCVMD